MKYNYFIYEHLFFIIGGWWNDILGDANNFEYGTIVCFFPLVVFIIHK